MLSDINPSATNPARQLAFRRPGGGVSHESWQARVRDNALRRLLNHTAILEARMVSIRGEMTFISSRLTKLGMQARLERLWVQVDARPFDEIAPREPEPGRAPAGDDERAGATLIRLDTSRDGAPVQARAADEGDRQRVAVGA